MYSYVSVLKIVSPITDDFEKFPSPCCQREIEMVFAKFEVKSSVKSIDPFWVKTIDCIIQFCAAVL